MAEHNSLLALLDGWAATMSADRQGAAIAAIGVLVGNYFGNEDLKSLNNTETLEQCLKSLLHQTTDLQRVYPRRLRWGVGSLSPARWKQFTTNIGPEVAASGWQSFIAQNEKVRLQCPGRDLTASDAAALYSWLSFQFAFTNAGIESIYFEWWQTPVGTPQFSESSWNWPLRLGFLPDEKSQELMRSFAVSRDWMGSLVKIIDIERTGERSDVLISPWNGRGTLQQLQTVRASASAILLLDHPPEMSEQAGSVFLELRAKAGASAIALLAGSADAETIVELVREISHDHPFDQAVSNVGRFSAQHLSLTIADADFIEKSQLSRLGVVWADRLAEQSAYALAYNIRITAQGRFDSESGNASELAAQAAGRYDFEEVRRLKADVWQVPVPKRRLVKQGSPGPIYGDRTAWHFLRVHIAPADKGDKSDFPAFPEDKIANTDGQHRLKIGIVAPGCDVTGLASNRVFTPALISGMVDELRIPFLRGSRWSRATETALLDISIAPSGPSTDALFLLNAPSYCRLRILVTDSNRILQTAILDIDGLSDVRKATKLEKISFQEEGVVRSSLEELSERRPFDLAILTNDTLTGMPQLTSIAGGKIKLGSLDEIKPIAARIEQRLSKLIDSPDDFQQPDSDALASVLRGLAQEGVLLRRYFEDEGLGPLLEAPPARLQVVSAKPDEALPIEFIYDGPAPNASKAAICPNQRQALGDGSCGSCPHRQSRSYVCALRFWGLTKVIERQLYRPVSDRETYVAAAEPVGRNRIGRPATRMLASSARARKFKGGANAFRALSERLAATTFTPLARLLSADDWNAWRLHISNSQPTLLVLIAHTDVQDSDEVLEIGDSDRLTDAEIDQAVVGSSHPIIVVLLGCETAKPDLRMAGFVASFRHAKAAVVIATLTPLLGRHAVPIADALVARLDKFWSEPRPTTIGDAIAEVRRSLMAEGLPAALTLVAFGDADWLLGDADAAT